MSEEFKVFIIFLIGIISAFLGCFTSGGVSAISFGLLTLLGLPPQIATITVKLGKIGDILWWLWVFYKNGHVNSKYFIISGPISMLGSFLWTYLIFSLSDWIIYLVSALSMIVLTIVSYRKKIGFHPSHILPTWLQVKIWYVTLFILTILGNLFIAGSGIWYYFANTYLLRVSALESKAIATANSLPWFLGALGWALVQWQYNIGWALALTLGMFLGGYFGTKKLLVMNTATLSKIILFSIVLFAFYFLALAYNSYV